MFRTATATVQDTHKGEGPTAQPDGSHRSPCLPYVNMACLHSSQKQLSGKEHEFPSATFGGSGNYLLPSIPEALASIHCATQRNKPNIKNHVKVSCSSSPLPSGEGFTVKEQPCEVYLELNSSRARGLRTPLSLRFFILQHFYSLRFLTQGVVGQGQIWDLELGDQGLVLALTTEGGGWRCQHHIPVLLRGH